MEKYGQKIIIYDRKDEMDKMWHSHLDGYNLHPKINFISDRKKFMKMNWYTRILYRYDHFRTKNKSPREKHETQKNGYIIILKMGLYYLQMDILNYQIKYLQMYIVKDIFNLQNFLMI